MRAMPELELEVRAKPLGYPQLPDPDAGLPDPDEFFPHGALHRFTVSLLRTKHWLEVEGKDGRTIFIAGLNTEIDTGSEFLAIPRQFWDPPEPQTPLSLFRQHALVIDSAAGSVEVIAGWAKARVIERTPTTTATGSAPGTHVWPPGHPFRWVRTCLLGADGQHPEDKPTSAFRWLQFWRKRIPRYAPLPPKRALISLNMFWDKRICVHLHLSGPRPRTGGVFQNSSRECFSRLPV